MLCGADARVRYETIETEVHNELVSAADVAHTFCSITCCATCLFFVVCSIRTTAYGHNSHILPCLARGIDDDLFGLDSSRLTRAER